MGIRVRKMLGYGLTGLSTDETEVITDPRINPDSIFLSQGNTRDCTVREYVRSTLDDGEKLENVLQGWMYSHLDPDSNDPIDAVQTIVDSASEICGTLLIRPVGDLDWYRFDNLMDYHEEEEKHASMVDSVKYLKNGIYPYNNSYVDALTHKRISWGDIDDWVRMNNSTTAPPELLQTIVEYTAKNIGVEVKTNEELKRRILPSPPDPIIHLARFGNLFTKPEYIYDLRPMIATWWA